MLDARARPATPGAGVLPSEKVSGFDPAVFHFLSKAALINTLL
jgi:hypothetical protein